MEQYDNKKREKCRPMMAGRLCISKTAYNDNQWQIIDSHHAWTCLPAKISFHTISGIVIENKVSLTITNASILLIINL